MKDYIEHQQEYKGEIILIWVRDNVRTFEWSNAVFYTMRSAKSLIDRTREIRTK